MTYPRSRPTDLAIELAAPIAFTPCWVIYAARYRDETAVACELLPELFAQAPQPARVATAPTQGEAVPEIRRLDPACVADLERLAGRLTDAVAPFAAALHPLTSGGPVAFSLRSETFWLVYRIDAAAVPRDADRQLPPAGIARLAIHLADTLHHLHATGRQHLDISPTTVCDDGELLFPGLALRNFAHHDEDLPLVTRAHYSPSELYDNSDQSAIGPWTDIYMASATLYALATAAPPPPRRRPFDPAIYRAQIVEALAEVPEHAALAPAIAAGLMPRIGDRPPDVDAWRAAMDIGVLTASIAAAQPARDEPADATAEPVEAAASDASVATPPDQPDPTIDTISSAADGGPVPDATAAFDDDDAEQQDIDVEGGAHQASPRRGPRKAWIMAATLIGAIGVVFLFVQGVPDTAAPPGTIIEGTPTPTPTPAEPAASIPPPPAPVPSPSPSPTAAPTTEPAPTAPPAAAPPEPPPAPAPNLAMLRGTWRRGDNPGCDAEIRIGENDFTVAIRKLLFVHRVVSQHGADWKTAMTGAAQGQFTIRLRDDRQSFQMSDGNGQSEVWTKCDR